MLRCKIITRLEIEPLNLNIIYYILIKGQANRRNSNSSIRGFNLLRKRREFHSSGVQETRRSNRKDPQGARIAKSGRFREEKDPI